MLCSLDFGQFELYALAFVHKLDSLFFVCILETFWIISSRLLWVYVRQFVIKRQHDLGQQMEPKRATYLIPDRRIVRTNGPHGVEPTYAIQTVGYVEVEFGYSRSSSDEHEDIDNDCDTEVREMPYMFRQI